MNDKIKTHVAEVATAREEGRSEAHDEETKRLSMEKLRLEEESRAADVKAQQLANQKQSDTQKEQNLLADLKTKLPELSQPRPVRDLSPGRVSPRRERSPREDEETNLFKAKRHKERARTLQRAGQWEEARKQEELSLRFWERHKHREAMESTLAPSKTICGLKKQKKHGNDQPMYQQQTPLDPAVLNTNVRRPRKNAAKSAGINHRVLVVHQQIRCLSTSKLVKSLRSRQKKLLTMMRLQRRRQDPLGKRLYAKGVVVTGPYHSPKVYGHELSQRSGHNPPLHRETCRKRKSQHPRSHLRLLTRQRLGPLSRKLGRKLGQRFHCYNISPI